jgi:CDGSH-type Zn-finger protein/uncharacterized Fe-S cluster protein YjdI
MEKENTVSDKPQEYRGQRIVIRFDDKACIHARKCVIDLPEVFQANVSGPWINPNVVDAELLAMKACLCPSGAITYERLDGGAEESAPSVNVTRVRENGPLAFHADLHIDGLAPRFRATLCRCGASEHKPFCDGSHVASGFQATGEPPTEASEPLRVRNGHLKVESVPDGPLHIEGNLEILSGTGRTVLRTQKASFCRCGASAKKPFCDGSHQRIGFKASGYTGSAGKPPATGKSSPAEATAGYEDHGRGPVGAEITIIQYGDYDCPHTRKSNRILSEIMAEEPDTLRYVFRYFPLRHMHQNAEWFAELAQAAAEHGRFWELHDRLMRHLEAPNERQVRADVDEAGLDFDSLMRAMGGKNIRERVERDVVSGKAAGIHSTPSFFFNGVLHDGRYDKDTVLQKIQEARRELA